MRDVNRCFMGLIKKYPKLASLIGAAAIGAAGYFGGPGASAATKALLEALFGG